MPSSDSEDDWNVSAARPGQTIGRYRVVRFLGAGAMGEIHLARDPSLDRVVAIKLLKRRAGAAAELENEARLLREAQALARLSHPNVVPVYDVGFHEKRLFIAMEYVPGRTLREWLAIRRRSAAQIIRVIVQAGRGLAAAHDAGLVHRDFKPDNVLVDREGRARVMDFGLARMHGDEPAQTSAEDGAEALVSDLTRTGWILGTPRYMSPEQHAGEPVDARSDQFAFCVTLFESLYGITAFAGKDLRDVSEAKRTGRIGDPGRGKRAEVARRVPAGVHEAILRGLRPDPADRFASMSRLLDAIETAIGPGRRSTGRIVALAAFVIVVVAIAAPTEPDACAAAGARVDELWDPEARAALGRVFRSSDRPFAEDGLAATAASLDGWVDRWRTARTEACHRAAQGADPRADAQLRCLEQRLQGLATTLDLLGRGEAPAIEHAVEIAYALPPIDDCVDALDDDDLPDDPARRTSVANTRARLAEVHAYLTAGLLGAAEATARLAVREAEDAVHPPAIATARSTLGDVLGHRGDPQAAARELGEAFWIAQEAAQDETAARTAIALAYWEGVTLGRHDEGLTWVRHARAALSRSGDPPLLRAQLLQNEALVLAAIQRFDEAIAKQDEAIAVRTEHAPDRPLELANAIAAAGGVLVQAGRDGDALAHYRRALQLREEVLGGNHPQLGESLFDVARVLHAIGDDAQAIVHLRRGIEVLERAHGESDRRLIVPLRDLGERLEAVGRHDEAERTFDRALSIARARREPDAVEIADLHLRLARVTHALGRRDRALAHLDRAREGAQAQAELSTAIEAMRHTLTRAP